MEAIKAAGLEVITPVVICNSDNFAKLDRFTGKQVKPGVAIMELTK
jgi:PTS system beta-glucosides-specific IIC component